MTKTKIKMTPDEMLKLAENVYDGFSAEEIAEMEKVMLDRSNFFSRNPNRLNELIEGIDEDSLKTAIECGKTVSKKSL